MTHVYPPLCPGWSSGTFSPSLILCTYLPLLPLWPLNSVHPSPQYNESAASGPSGCGPRCEGPDGLGPLYPPERHSILSCGETLRKMSPLRVEKSE
uniref:Uncharacterized protein n=1 Tax=Knipowitschia caucasica TaxID=637954 RepID=A0AAV2KR95_KNICA